jgi:hypothetical protein
MKYRLLGKSGLRVSEAALGTMTFGDELGWGSPKAEAQKVYETYSETGGYLLFLGESGPAPPSSMCSQDVNWSFFATGNGLKMRIE